MGRHQQDRAREGDGAVGSPLSYSAPQGVVAVERDEGGAVVVRMPRARLWAALAVWVPALMVSGGMCVALAWGLRGARPAAIVGGVVCFGILLGLSAVHAAIHLGRAVTAAVLAAEVRVADQVLSVRLPGFCRVIEYRWERGQVEDVRMFFPVSQWERRWRVVLWVASEDGHTVGLRLVRPTEESVVREMEEALRAALGL
jgi:hypothetical protein